MRARDLQTPEAGRRGRTSRRAGAAILVATLALMGGCGGGDDPAPASDAAGLPPAGPPPATGAGAAESPGAALAAIGVADPVDPTDLASTLVALDRFGMPHDLLDAQLSEESDAETAAAPEGDVPPVAPVPGVGGAPTLEAPLAMPAPFTPVTSVIPVAPAAPPAPVAPTAPAVVPLTPGADAPAPTKRGLEAVFSLEGETLVAKEGDLIPPERQELRVQSLGEGYVVLKLTRGLLPDGGDLLFVEVGGTATLDDAQNERSYSIKLVDVRADQTP